jgi:hypothetical protein
MLHVMTQVKPVLLLSLSSLKLELLTLYRSRIPIFLGLPQIDTLPFEIDIPLFVLIQQVNSIIFMIVGS